MEEKISAGKIERAKGQLGVAGLVAGRAPARRAPVVRMSVVRVSVVRMSVVQVPEVQVSELQVLGVQIVGARIPGVLVPLKNLLAETEPAESQRRKYTPAGNLTGEEVRGEGGHSRVPYGT